jgi:branched-chain amino acid transport system substrate-binding protein
MRIGVYGPEDGDGIAMRRGAGLAADEANAGGGVLGRPVRIAFRSSDGPWGSGAGELVKLVYDDRVLAILGALDGTGTHIAEQIVTKAWVPLVTPSATDPSLTRANVPWIFRCLPDDRGQAEALASHLLGVRSTLRVAGIASDDRESRIGMAELERLARQRGNPLSLSLKYRIGDRDFARQLSLLEGAGVEALVIWGPPRESALLLGQLRIRCPGLVVYGSAGLASPEFLQAAGADAEGLIVPVTEPAGDPAAGALTFRARYRAVYGGDPDRVACLSYDGTCLLISAVRRAGPDRGGIRQALSKIIRFVGVTGRIGFDPTGGTTAKVGLARVTGGRFTPIP